MTVDWVATLQEQADLVIKMARDVEKELDTDLTVEQASRLHRMVESIAQNFDRLVELMNEHDLEESYVDAAETIEDTWINLSLATANRLRTLRGLEPIDIAPDDQNDI